MIHAALNPIPPPIIKLMIAIRIFIFHFSLPMAMSTMMITVMTEPKYMPNIKAIIFSFPLKSTSRFRLFYIHLPMHCRLDALIQERLL